MNSDHIEQFVGMLESIEDKCGEGFTVSELINDIKDIVYKPILKLDAAYDVVEYVVSGVFHREFPTVFAEERDGGRYIRRISREISEEIVTRLRDNDNDTRQSKENTKG